MPEYPPHTWDNERWVAERFSEAVETDDAAGQEKYGQRLLDGLGDDRWTCLQPAEEGLYLPFHAFDFDDPRSGDLACMFLEDEFPSDKSEVFDFSKFSMEVQKRWYAKVLDHASAPELATSWVLFTLRRERRQPLYLAATIYVGEFGPQPAAFQYVAVGASYVAVMALLKATGFTGLKDYDARSAEVLAQKREPQDTVPAPSPVTPNCQLTSALDVLVSVGFSQDPKGLPGGVCFDFGNFRLSALRCTNRWFADIVLLTGALWVNRGTLSEVADEIPALVESREQALAYVASVLDRACRPELFTPQREVPWLEEGRRHKLLVPWERDLAEGLARQAEYAASPRCYVEREWMRVALKTLERGLQILDHHALIAVTFDGEVLTIRCDDTLCVMPARGAKWQKPVQVAAASLRTLPKRLKQYVEVMVWRNELHINGVSYPLAQET